MSGIASAIDVPVYLLAVVTPLDHPGEVYAVVPDHQGLGPREPGTLDRRGYALVSAPAHTSLAARELITELRHQYLLAFEASQATGWYSLNVRTRRRELTVRARSGYLPVSRDRSVEAGAVKLRG